MSRRKQNKPKAMRDDDNGEESAATAVVDETSMKASKTDEDDTEKLGDDDEISTANSSVSEEVLINADDDISEKLEDACIDDKSQEPETVKNSKDLDMTVLAETPLHQQTTAANAPKVSALDAVLAAVAADDSLPEVAVEMMSAAMTSSSVFPPRLNETDSDGGSRASSEKTNLSSNDNMNKSLDCGENKNSNKSGYAKILPVSLDTGDQGYVCPICNDTLDDSHSLTVHIRNHNSKAPSCHSCTICGKTLCSQSSLDRHMLVHSGERPFRCQVCDLSFTTNGNMHRHMRVHEKEFAKSPGSLKQLLDASLQPVTGPQSDKRPRKRRSGLAGMVTDFVEKRSRIDGKDEVNDALRKKILTNGHDSDSKAPADGDGEKLHCPMCLKTFLCKNGLESHVEASHPDYDIKCLVCNVLFSNHRMLRAHNQVIHGKADFTNGMAVPIGFHELAFADFSAVKFPLIAQRWCEENPRRSSSNFHKYECGACSHAFPSEESLELHVAKHHCEKCEVCGLQLPDGEALRLHKQSVHATRALYFDDPPKPEENKEKFLNILELKHDDHEQDSAATDIAKANDDDDDDDSVSVSNDKDSDYYTKLRQNTRPTALKIEENNNSSDFADIQKIIQTANSSTLPPLSATPTTAPLAPAFNIFSKSSPMENDEDSEEEGQPPFCEDDFLSDSDMSEQASTSGTPQKFNCKYCEMRFDNFNALKVHMRQHFGLSPYKCNMCPYSSADKTTLVRHLRTHNGERPFQCRICQFAFTTKANCERHVRKKHSKDAREEIDEAVGYNQLLKDVSPSMSEETYHSTDTVCKYCGQDFKFYRALKHHLRSHTSCRLKPFTCAVCDMGFSTKANCVRHIQKRHHEIDSSQLENNVKMTTSYSDQSTPTHTPPPPGLISHHLSIFAPPPAHAAKSSLPPTIPLLNPDSALAQLAKLSVPKVDAPLDFTKRTINEAPSAILKAIRSENAPSNEPMDLSLPNKEARLPKPASVTRPVPIHPAFNVQFPFMTGLSDLNTMTAVPHSGVYKCPICHVQFNLESKLYLHMKMHATSRPFQCTFCPAGFTVKTNLEIHIRTRHDMNTNSNNTAFTPARNRFISPNLKMIQKQQQQQQQLQQFSYLKPKYPALASSIAGDIDPLIKPGGETDLSSVSKMLDAASRDAFQSLMTQQKPLASSEFTEQKEDEDHDLLVMGDGHMMEIKKEGNQHRREIPDYSSSADASSSPDKTPRKKRNSYANAPNRVSCPYCSRTFPWISSLRRHILTHTGEDCQKPYKCPECPVHFSTKSNRERHLMRKHGVNPANPNTRQIMDRPYKCQLCVFSSFSKPEKLIHHYKSKHPETDPPANIHEMSVEMWLTSPNRPVSVTDDDDGSLIINDDEEWSEDEDEDEDEEMMSPEKSYIISPSPSLEDESIVIKREISDVEEDEDVAMDTSLCTEERETPEPANRRLLEQYVVSPSPSSSPLTRPSPGRTTVINPERDNYNVDKILDCWQCSMHFATRKLLLRHLKEHNSDFPFKCYLCDASYLTRKECIDHKIIKHVDDWVMLKARNKIEEVGDFCVTMERLSEVADEELNTSRVKEVRVGAGDEMTIMAAERKVFCTLCPKKFWSLQDLRRHMRSHTGEKPFECDICGRYFTLKHSMMRHRRKHTEADYKPYVTPRPSFITDVMGVDMNSFLGTDSNDDRSIGTPDHEHFLALRERMERSINNSPMLPLAPPLSNVSQMPSNHPATYAKAPSPPTGAPPSVRAAVRGTKSSIMEDIGSDMLHNLLGVDNSAIDQMLSAKSADDAAKLLGVN